MSFEIQIDFSVPPPPLPPTVPPPPLPPTVPPPTVPPPPPPPTVPPPPLPPTVPPPPLPPTIPPPPPPPPTVPPPPLPPTVPPPPLPPTVPPPPPPPTVPPPPLPPTVPPPPLPPTVPPPPLPPTVPPPTFPPSIDTHLYAHWFTSYTAPAGIGQTDANYKDSTKSDTSASHKSDTSAATRYNDDTRYYTAREYSKPRVRYSEGSERDRGRSYERYRRERDYRESRSRKYRSSRSPSHSRMYRRYRREYERTHHDYERRHRDRSRSRICGSSGEMRHSSRREMSFGKYEASHKPMSDREKILEESRRNSQTSDDFIEKTEQLQIDHNPDKEEVSKLYLNCPAELYYKPVEGGVGVQQTPELEEICETFFKTLIERGRKARLQVDEIPPVKQSDEGSSSSSSSSKSDDCLDEDGLKRNSDKLMEFRRLHNQLWYNNTGELNAGRYCQCSDRDSKLGLRHGVYATELEFPKCVPQQNNLDKLYHYRITVSPPTNFLTRTPTTIIHEEHEFLFTGFSMFSHYKLAKLPTCKVIRFNIEYTILYVEEPAPQNFSIQELDLFEEYLFYELLELVDLNLGKGTNTTCSQFHFMPRFVRNLPEGGCEILSMCHILKYLIDESGLLIPPENLKKVHSMHHNTWQKFCDRNKDTIVTNPGKKPCSVRVDQLDRTPPSSSKDNPLDMTFYPEIIHFGIVPPQFNYVGKPEYQKAWRSFVKYRYLMAHMGKPSYKEREKLSELQAKLQEIKAQSNTKRDVIVDISSEGFHTTGLKCDIVQHAMLIPAIVFNIRMLKSLDSFEENIGYVFKQRELLQTALTHPSYRENSGTNPDHVRNSLVNCGIRQLEYGDKTIHHTKKKGVVALMNIMSRFGKQKETVSEMKHNERLEFLGDAVVGFLSSVHLFRMFPSLTEGALTTYRTCIVQNQHLALLAKNIALEKYMLYAHTSDMSSDPVISHAMANCFEALMGAIFLDGGLEVADRVFAFALWGNQQDLLETWSKERADPLQEQEPNGDRKYIKDNEFLQRLTKFEESIGVQFKHIRVLARAFTHKSVGFTYLTLGTNERLEFLGDAVLQLIVTNRLYRHFPDHNEGHLSMLRKTLVSNSTQSTMCDDLNIPAYAIYSHPNAIPITKKHKADLLEAFLGALYLDKNMKYCETICNVCLFPRLEEFIIKQDWIDSKSKLQHYFFTRSTMEGGDTEPPLYKVIDCLGSSNSRVYTVAVDYRGSRLAIASGHTIKEAEMNAAEKALADRHALFPSGSDTRRRDFPSQ